MEGEQELRKSHEDVGEGLNEGSLKQSTFVPVRFDINSESESWAPARKLWKKR